MSKKTGKLAAKIGTMNRRLLEESVDSDFVYNDAQDVYNSAVADFKKCCPYGVHVESRPFLGFVPVPYLGTEHFILDSYTFGNHSIDYDVCGVYDGQLIGKNWRSESSFHVSDSAIDEHFDLMGRYASLYSMKDAFGNKMIVSKATACVYRQNDKKYPLFYGYYYLRDILEKNEYSFSLSDVPSECMSVSGEYVKSFCLSLYGEECDIIPTSGGHLRKNGSIELSSMFLVRPVNANIDGHAKSYMLLSTDSLFEAMSGESFRDILAIYEKACTQMDAIKNYETACDKMSTAKAVAEDSRKLVEEKGAVISARIALPRKHLQIEQCEDTNSQELLPDFEAELDE